MRAERARHAAYAVALGALVVAWTGCSAPAGPPAIAAGTPCAACSMPIEDTRFACERRTGARWRAYDSIECLIRDVRDHRGIRTDAAYLADYDARSLHSADSMWVVQGSFPSPMGGGYAAFGDHNTADEVALETQGKVARLAEFLPGAAGNVR